MEKLLLVTVVAVLNFVLVVSQFNPKPGKCPSGSDCNDLLQPDGGCQTDSDCRGNLKCCDGCCKHPITVFCRYTDVNGKVFNGECKLPKYCDKKQFGCPAIPCTGAGEGCICCFKRKKVAPPNAFCNPPAIKPGKCPRSPVECIGSGSCDTDRDCPLNRKCCDNCCTNPVTVICGYTDASGKEFRGQCKLKCEKGEKGCPGIKCLAPWDKCTCCFPKKMAPSKSICKKGPPPPVTTCTIRTEDNSWTGQCMPAGECAAPNKWKFPCSIFNKCPNDEVCCFRKKGRPPAVYCNP